MAAAPLRGAGGALVTHEGRTRSRRTPDPRLLGIYLNDHLAGATAGVQRARHLARAYSDTPHAAELDTIATEIEQDRESLVDLMTRLDVPTRRHKIWGGWAAERLGRLKSNGRLVRRSPLSPLIELEVMRIGVTGKAAVWQTLRQLRDAEHRLDPRALDDLLERADRQARLLEELRLRQVSGTFQHAD